MWNRKLTQVSVWKIEKFYKLYLVSPDNQTAKQERESHQFHLLANLQWNRFILKALMRAQTGNWLCQRGLQGSRRAFISSLPVCALALNSDSCPQTRLWRDGSIVVRWAFLSFGAVVWLSKRPSPSAYVTPDQPAPRNKAPLGWKHAPSGWVGGHKACVWSKCNLCRDKKEWKLR